MSLIETLTRRLEELVNEKIKLEEKVSEMQKINLEDITNNKLLPDGFFHISKLN
jgi:hypothetical protein